MTKKTVKAQCSVSASDDTYPERETFIPFSPLDFENVDLPEVHQTTHLPLDRLPFMLLDKKRGLEMLLPLRPPLPQKMSSPLWESNQLLSTLDVELPLLCYDLNT